MLDEPAEGRSFLPRFAALLRAHRGAVAAALFVVALLPRLYVALFVAHGPVWDGQFYHLGAARIAEGHGYSGPWVTAGVERIEPWAHYPVGYSAFLAAVYVVFGAKPVVGAIAGAFVGAATSVVVHRLALTFLSDVRALIAGALTALHPGLILYSGLLMTEPLAALGLVLAPLVFLTFRTRPIVGAALSGIVLGLTTLVRPETVLSVPALALLGAKRDRRSTIFVAVVATASCLAVVAPWTVRNAVQMDGFAFVSTNGGWNLAVGSSPHATGRFEELRPEDGCTDIPKQLDEDRCWLGRARTWIADDPARWLALVPKKLAYTFNHQSFAVGYYAVADPDSWPEDRMRRWRALLSYTQFILLFAAALGAIGQPQLGAAGRLARAAFAVVVLAFVVGIVPGWRKAWPLALLGTAAAVSRGFGRTRDGLVGYGGFALAALIVVHVVFFGEDRYQIIVTPLLVLLAASLRFDFRRINRKTGRQEG